MPTYPPTSTLHQCNDLNALRCSLSRERLQTVEEVACGNRFKDLCHDEKNLITCMSKELVQYDHYLNALRDAAFLNKFITMVQTFTQKKTREVYLKLCGVVGAAYCNCLEDFLFHLRDVFLLHDQLLGYIKGQSYRSWAVGTARNTTHKYKPLFRYQFPACDFNHPLVIRNPDLWVDNGAKMFYTLVDLFTKFKCTTAYALSSTDLLWLGKSVGWGTGVLKSSCECVGDKLWLGNCQASSSSSSASSSSPVHSTHSTHSDGHPPTTPCCSQYNAIWFPQFHMYVQFACTQTLCKNDLFIEWSATTNCTDTVRQQALLDRCAGCPNIEYELFFRPTVDWNLFCPFKLHLNYTQSDGCWCPANNVDAHTQPYNHLIEVHCVREDYLLVLQKKTPIRAGTYVHTAFKTCNVNPTYWKAPLDQLVQFYKCVIDTQEMQLMQTESQTKQMASVVDCIQKNVAMYQDLIGDYVRVDNVQAMNKIRKLGELVDTIEGLLEQEPLTVVARSKATGKTHVIREEVKGCRRGNEMMGKDGKYGAGGKYEKERGYGYGCEAEERDYDSDISRFSDGE